MKQLSSGNVKSGDFFYIPAINASGRHGFVISRYIELVPENVGHLIEVFETFYFSPPAAIDEVQTEQRLFRPILCSLRFSEIPKWRILFSDSKYKKSDSDFENIVISFHNNLWVGGKKVMPTNIADLKKYEDSTCWRMHHIIFRVNAHLAGLFGPNEPYDYHRVPPGKRIDDSAAKEQVFHLAEEINSKFDVWAGKTKMGSRK